jgi:hypothetical protein
MDFKDIEFRLQYFRNTIKWLVSEIGILKNTNPNELYDEELSNLLSYDTTPTAESYFNCHWKNSLLEEIRELKKRLLDCESNIYAFIT